VINGNGQNLFNACSITDLAALLEECGVTLDTSKAYSLNYAFHNSSSLNHLPTISTVGCMYDLNATFSGKALETIDKIIVGEGTKFKMNAFGVSTELKNLIMEGALKSDISFAVCPLSKESIESIFNCLYDYGAFASLAANWTTTTAISWTCSEADAKQIKIKYTGSTINLGTAYVQLNIAGTLTKFKFNDSKETPVISLPKGTTKISSVYNGSQTISITSSNISTYLTISETTPGASNVNVVVFNCNAVNKAYETATDQNDGMTSSAWASKVSDAKNKGWIVACY
jgi:hypothetical protein